MAKKKKQFITLMSLVALMVLVIGLYYIVPKGENSDSDENEETQTISIENIEKEQVSEISIQKDDKTIQLIKKGSEWKFSDKKNVPVNTELIDGMLGALSPVEAVTELDYVKEQESDYGLDKPVMVVSILTRDGEKHEYSLGGSVPVEGGYYASVSANQEKLYAISDAFYKAFYVEEKDIYQGDEAPEINSSYVSEVSVQNREGKDFYAREVSEEEQVDFYSTWNIEKPYSDAVAANSNKINELQSKFASFNITEMVEYKADHLESYGLDKPAATVKVKYFTLREGAEESTKEDVNGNEVSYVKKEDRENKVFSFSIGDLTEDGENYYIQMKGSKGVYLMQKKAAEGFTAMEAFDYVDHCIYSVLATKLDGYDVIAGGQKVKVVRKELSSDNSEKAETEEQKGNNAGTTDNANNEWYVNGKKVSDEKEEDFLSPYSSMYLLEFSSTIKNDVKPKTDKPILTVVYHSKYGDDTVKYLPYDGTNFYRVEKNGVAIFLTDKRAVDDLKAKLLALPDLVK